MLWLDRAVMRLFSGGGLGVFLGVVGSVAVLVDFGSVALLFALLSGAVGTQPSAPMAATRSLLRGPAAVSARM